MSLVKSKGFKYFKNLVIGVGASIVMIGALGKINSEPWGGTAITIGLITESILFFFLGIIPPEKDYYWEKLYPGLDAYNAKLTPLSEGPLSEDQRPLNAVTVEGSLGGMLTELQTMSKSLSSLKALQEVDFSQTSDQIKSMGNFYDRMNQAIAELGETVEETKTYKSNLAALNQNITGVNEVYSNVVQSKDSFERLNAAMAQLGDTVEDAVQYKSEISSLNNNLKGLNSVYGNVLTAMTGGKKSKS
jgi:uncharacterized protein YukE